MGSSLLKHNILVCGFYFKGNVGDDLFIDAFRKIFPEYYFTFTDHITTKHLDGVDAVFFGGGSFLEDQPEITEDAFPKLLTKKICYIGVGLETNIHPFHKKLMNAAKLIATRSNEFEKIKSLNNNIIKIPDLVYSLENNTKSEKLNKTILYVPNIATVPQYFDPHWKHTFWECFKLEFAQVLDYLIELEYNVHIFSMCKNNQFDDSWAGTEIVSKMKYRRKNFFIDESPNYIDLFSRYDLVITQRYHGIILSELARTPYVSISHHDKLNNSYLNLGSFISYFGISKDKIINEIHKQLKSKYSDILPIENNIFRELKHKVSQILLG